MRHLLLAVKAKRTFVNIIVTQCSKSLDDDGSERQWKKFFKQLFSLSVCSPQVMIAQQTFLRWQIQPLGPVLNPERKNLRWITGNENHDDKKNQSEGNFELTYCYYSLFFYFSIKTLFR